MVCTVLLKDENLCPVHTSGKNGPSEWSVRTDGPSGRLMFFDNRSNASLERLSKNDNRSIARPDRPKLQFTSYGPILLAKVDEK